MINHGNSFLQNLNQTKCNSFQKETKREFIFCFMTQKNDSIIHNCVYSGNSIIRDRKRDESEGLFSLTGRNRLRIFLIISGSMSQKYFWADRLQRLSWWFSMISAPKEQNKSIKASHTINRCGWLYLLPWILFPRQRRYNNKGHALYRAEGNTSIPVQVKYPNPKHKTNGGTKRWKKTY